MPPQHDADESDGRPVDSADDEVIRNLSAVVSLPPPAAAGDGTADLSSDTSLTSIASELSDGAPRPPSRPRGASPPPSDPATPGGGISRPGSTPRSRPSSNPRTRTPLRRESPLPVPSSRGDVRAASVGSAGRTAGDGGGLRRAGGEARRHRAGSIPEEHEGETHDGGEEGEGEAHGGGGGGTAGGGAGRLLSLAARSAAAAARSDPAPSRPARRPGLSSKQGPSRRKQRRWDNDRFVGTASERLHVQLLESSGGPSDYWTEHVMPNYPTGRTSHFERLCSDETKGRVRERFVRGEVAEEDGGSRRRRPEGADDVSTKYKKMGITDPASASDDELGGRLARRLAPRIRSVLSRCATSANSSESSPRNVICALEAYLISLALGRSGEVEGGYPPLQSDEAYIIFDGIFAEGPRVVLRDRPRDVQCRSGGDGKGGKRGGGRVDAVSVPTVHFYFPDVSPRGARGKEKNDDDERGRSAAFHRILLYAICSFHGLETSSSVVTRRSGRETERSKRGVSRNDERRRMKVVTVQGGILLAPELTVLDHCCE